MKTIMVRPPTPGAAAAGYGEAGVGARPLGIGMPEERGSGGGERGPLAAVTAGAGDGCLRPPGRGDGRAGRAAWRGHGLG